MEDKQIGEDFKSEHLILSIFWHLDVCEGEVELSSVLSYE